MVALNRVNVVKIPLIRLKRYGLLLMMGILISVYLSVSNNNSLQGKYLSWWSDLFWTLAALAAGWRSIVTAKSRQLKYERLAWYWFGAAALSWFVGMIVWDYYEVFHETMVPFPSLGDWFFIGYAICFIVGFAYYRAEKPAREFTMIQISNLGLIVSTSVVLCFIILSEPLNASTQSLEYRSYALIHGIMTIGCFIFSLYCFWFYSWKENRFSLQLILLSLLIMAFADTLYAFQLLGKNFNASSFLNVYWLLSFALQYWAAVEQDALALEVPKNVDAKGMFGSSNLEAIMPALCLFTILVFSLSFRHQFNNTTFIALILGAIAFSGFLTLREWYSNRLENRLMDEVRFANSQLENRVQQRTAELLNANSELEAFCYSVSHDLRAPLRGIKGFSQILLEECADAVNDQGQEYLNRVCSGVENMSDIIDAILTLSRLSRHAIVKETVYLNKIADSILYDYQEKEPNRQVSVEIKENLAAFGDPHLLRISMEHLLSNAWKYSSKKEKAVIEVGSYRKGGDEVFFVKDNGVGFDMKYANKIFEPFQRLHGQAFPGLGVGLATVFRCVRRHDGQIWVDSHPDQGTTFSFSLPPRQIHMPDDKAKSSDSTGLSG